MRELSKQVREHLFSFKAKYGICPEMRRQTKADEADIVHLEKLDLLEAAAALPRLRQALAKYPAAYVLFCELKRLRLVKTLQSCEPSVGVVCYAGRVYYEDRSVYIATCGADLYSLEGALHHELFHLSDSAHIQRTMQANQSHLAHLRLAPAMYQRRYDSQWEQLNPLKEKAYLGQAYWTSSLQGDEKDLEGFALAAGKRDPWEDRATTAGLLMTEPEVAFSKAERDEAFRLKLGRVMTFYKERSEGKMDERYFTDLAAGKVTEGYWKKTTG